MMTFLKEVMLKGLIGKKLNMTQGFDSHGRSVPITNISIQPNYIIQIKSEEIDKYKAVQLGADFVKKPNKPLQGHINKSKINHAPKFLREFDFDADVAVGGEVKLEDVFNISSVVNVIGVSKGKGFAGVVKRHGFAGGPRTHGQSDRERAPGSIGATTTPGRVYKGTKMAGHMGNERVKVQALEILSIDKENNILSVIGSVPGASGGVLLIEKSKKKRKRYHEPEIPPTPTVSVREDKEEVSPDQEVKQTGIEKGSLVNGGQESEVKGINDKANE